MCELRKCIIVFICLVSFPCRNSNTLRGHLCILSQKYFPIASVDREKSENLYIFYGICTRRGVRRELSDGRWRWGGKVLEGR